MDYQEVYNLQEENKNLKKKVNLYKNLIDMVGEEIQEHIDCIEPILDKSFVTELKDLLNEMVNCNIKYSL